jgi:hypothetical protein
MDIQKGRFIPSIFILFVVGGSAACNHLIPWPYIAYAKGVNVIQCRLNVALLVLIQSAVTE